MAEEIGDEYDFTVRSTVPTKYPWDEWCNGKVWKVEEGTDFQMAAKSFRNYLHNVAKNRSDRGIGLGVEDLSEDHAILVQATIRKGKPSTTKGKKQEQASPNVVVFQFYEVELEKDGQVPDQSDDALVDDVVTNELVLDNVSSDDQEEFTEVDAEA
jgi:hypothetical protein